MEKQKIINTIEQLAKEQEKFQVSDILARFTDAAPSRQYLNIILLSMVESGQLVRSGITRHTYYALPSNATKLAQRITRTYTNSDKLSDYEVFNDLINTTVILKKVPEEVVSILTFSFTEMMNNAIEHSGSKKIKVELFVDRGDIVFTIRDYGVGVFNSIKKKFHLENDLFAIQDLLKGKTTTAPKAHSGEGIFFTSKIADQFILRSYSTQLLIDNKISDVFIDDVRQTKGTLVSFRLSDKSDKHLSPLFQEYASEADDYAFNKTLITVKLYTMGTIYVSRSQARRLLASLGEKFKTLVLDYQNVPSIGQAFADEIYRVFQNAHPGIKIESINTNKNIDFMIGRAKR